MARFMEITSINPKMKQKEIAKKLGFSNSTLQRYRNDIKMQSPYQSNNPKRPPKTSNDLKGPQMTSEDEKNETVFKKMKSKNILKGGDPNHHKHSNARDLLEQYFCLIKWQSL